MQPIMLELCQHNFKAWRSDHKVIQSTSCSIRTKWYSFLLTQLTPTCTLVLVYHVHCYIVTHMCPDMLMYHLVALVRQTSLGPLNF